MNHLIEVSHLCKTFRVAKRDAGAGQALKSLFHREYDYIHALDDISFSISSGEIVGYIGSNGSGKSSTIKILSGILTPGSGTWEQLTVQAAQAVRTEQADQTSPASLDELVAALYHQYRI